MKVLEEAYVLQILGETTPVAKGSMCTTDNSLDIKGSVNTYFPFPFTKPVSLTSMVPDKLLGELFSF